MSPPGSVPSTASGRPAGRWWAALLALTAGAVGLRAGYVLVVLDGVPPGLDAIWYALQGGTIRSGHGFVVPTSLFEGHPRPTAGFPPLYPAWQSAWQTAFGGSLTAVRMAGLLPAAATVVLTGVLGRRALGPRWGLVAAGIVALHPGVIATDGAAMSESLTVPLVLAALVIALGLVDGRATVARLGLLGVVCGAAALTRQDLLLLLPLLALPAALASSGGRGRRVGAAALVLVAAAALVLPWAGRNQRAVDSFAISTLSPASALAGANCDRTYAGASLGSWEHDCVLAAAATVESPREGDLAAAYRHRATAHARAHLSRTPLVAAARQARVWSLWDPRDLARRDRDESRRYGWQLGARPVEAAIAVGGVAGLLLLVRRRRAHLLLLAPVAVVAVSATASYGNPRFAAIAQPVLAIGVAALARSLRGGSRPGCPSGRAA